MAITAIIFIIRYNTDIPIYNEPVVTVPTNTGTHHSLRMFTGINMTNRNTQTDSPLSGTQTTYSCLTDNDESCFTITTRSGDYKSYFNAYRRTMFQDMIAVSGSTVTQDDMNAQIDAGITDVRIFTGINNTVWHLADIGMEMQHLYIERPWGTLIVIDSL